VPAADEDLATALLWEAGTHGIEVRPSDEHVVLLAYFPESSDVEGALRPLPSARLEPVPVPDVDWVRNFRETFTAFDVGRFRVVPAWEDPPASPFVLRIDPARAFGTGTHETTRLCLRALARLADESPLGRVLDLGAGTGILAVAAHLLGSQRVMAVDMDHEAVASTRHHALLNNVPILVVRGDGGRALKPGTFDLVLANLTAPLLVERSDEILGLVAPGGRLVLSGLLSSELQEIETTYRAFPILSRTIAGEWGALVLGNAR
jgi:ribosomal protein L11 methyltransferase